MRPKSRTLSWERVNGLYSNVLRFIVRYQKSFLLIFVIVVPVLIYGGIKSSKFQMFESFDASSIDITFKADSSTSLEESLKIVQTLERDLLAERERFFIKNVSSTAGYRRSATGGAEMYPYVGYITLELRKKSPDNFLDKYITPYLSLYYDDRDRVRDRSSKEISKELRTWLKEQGYKEAFNLKNLMVVEKRMGGSKADIRIGVISDDYQKAIRAVRQIQQSLDAVEGVKFSGDNIKTGVDEIKLTVNEYGEKLGLTEAYLGSYVSDLYLAKRVGVIFDDQSLLEVKVTSFYQDDYSYFETLEIPLKDGRVVRLKDVSDFEVVKSLEKLVKDDGETNFYVFANVDARVITASEAMERIQPTLDKLNEEGLRLKLKGEAEQKKKLETDLVLATTLSIILIFISILYLFNSIRETMIVISVIPFSLLGVFIGHYIMGLNLSLPSLIGALGLAGVIVNDGIIMMATLKTAMHVDEIFALAGRRFRPIVLTSLTTVLGLSSLIFFASGEAATFQPLAVTLGFGLLWGTILNLFYLPAMYSFTHKQRVQNGSRDIVVSQSE